MELEPVLITGIVFGFTYAVIYLLVRKSEKEIKPSHLNLGGFFMPDLDFQFLW